ncbi:MULTISPECIES: MaoC family dehydratase [Pseudomonas]|uniref:Putative MaoC-like dehydratase protein n=1 Tax=Pseudomonas fluorescens (strain Pf0-1) TaxID=205922 RepID=Q3K8X3_PSEPF|nr:MULTISPECIES: MaoC family dehydratase [Pseudomonas]ABA75781.1 putative MaoC-like dehydratase protein [Pseudomonas fluorescens Pf0-1]MBL0793582.1 MaoC family dehydratase [Pseudomonas sp. B7]MBX8625644.1 MaoC family dehydratase [Pseudomonas glycinae]MBY9025362.1 MaoC family dehydratase [Pseudomonas fluorescens]MBY9031784.1 MaoC family dehydratase [Pseudomonas fluorescens]
MTTLNDFLSGLSIEQIEVGMQVSYSQTITDADVKAYAGLSGDNNPVHMSDEYAKDSRFKARIAHGLFSAGFFSALFGTRLPGPGCVYVSQNLVFKAPVYLQDTVVAIVCVKDVNVRKRIVTFRTYCTVKDQLVIDGEAQIYVPKKPAAAEGSVSA